MAGDPIIFDGHNDVLSRLLEAERGAALAGPISDPATRAASFFERSDQGHRPTPRTRRRIRRWTVFGVRRCRPTGMGASHACARRAHGWVCGASATPAQPGLRAAQCAGRAGVAVSPAAPIRRSAPHRARHRRPASLSARRGTRGGGPLRRRRADRSAAGSARGLLRRGCAVDRSVWSRANDFGEGVPYLFPHSPDTGPGLSEAGKQLVRACNRLGIMVDLAHINERGFWDVAALSDRPLVASHSNAHALTPSPRNLIDRQLDAIRASGGVVGVNFYTGFLRADGARQADTPIARLVEHFQYLVERMGIDHVGFGADLDGALIPDAVRDVAGLPRVMAALRAAGFGEPELKKLAHDNWLRVLGASWVAAGV